MKTTNQKTLKMAQALLDARNAMKELERQEKDLRNQIKEIMGNENMLEAGDVVIFIKERTRIDLDKAALKAALGDNIKKFEKESTYSVLEINTKGA